QQEPGHHGIMSKWKKAAFGDKYNAKVAPSVKMSFEQHKATFGVFNSWRKQMTEKMGGVFDWNKVTDSQMQGLSERMFDAAGIPANVRGKYYEQFSNYVETIKKQCKK